MIMIEMKQLLRLTDLPQGNNPFASTTQNVPVSMNDLFSEEWFVRTRI